MRKIRRLAAHWCFLGWALLLAGCAGPGVFTIDTSEPDPLIYGPDAAPDGPLWVRLDGVTLSCEEVAVDVPDVPAKISFVHHYGPTLGGVRRSVVARIRGKDVAPLARRDDLAEKLLAVLRPPGEPKDCVFEGETAAAANLLRERLPRRFSGVLHSAYNHQLWPPRDTTQWISMDLQPGMRLRLENSIPIAPAGINTRDSHPSVFAAPAYLHFHALTSAELCDPRAKPQVQTGSFHCKGSPGQEGAIFLSAGNGLARLGLPQKTDGNHVLDKQVIRGSSGPVDLQERSNEGEGAWRHWRVWIPANRVTHPNTQVVTDGGAGSKEGEVPLLVAAKTVGDLGSADAGKGPCAAANANARCHGLHYRVLPIPEIQVRVDGAPQWVTVGTTLQDLLAHRMHDVADGLHPQLGPASVDARHWASAGRRVLAEVHVYRRHRGGQHAVVPRRLDDESDVQRFLRLQLLPGDDIRWR